MKTMDILRTILDDLLWRRTITTTTPCTKSTNSFQNAYGHPSLFLLIVFIFFKCIQYGVYATPTALRSQNTEIIQYFKSPRPILERNGGSNEISQQPRLYKELVFIALLPGTESDNKNDCIMPKVLPVLELAITHVLRLGFSNNALIDITLISRDTFCSSIYGPIGFFEITTKWSEINAVFGLPCEYVLAPISRYAGVWQIPVITSGGNAADFDKKAISYPTLTRIKGALVNNLGQAVRAIFTDFNWTRAALLYQNENIKIKGNSVCFFCISVVHEKLQSMSVLQQGFDTSVWTRKDIVRMLMNVEKHARIVIVCADPQSIRQIMLIAEDLNMIDDGEYVFINIQLFSRIKHGSSKPWLDKSDTLENNERARKAYTAMLIVAPKQQDDEEYIRVSNYIKAIAAAKYNFTFQENEALSSFVMSFYDGVLLYANALNDSIREDPSILSRPLNGSNIVQRMWNRSFMGTTGKVLIDENGDRICAYSLLDMNPTTGHFQLVAHFQQNRLEYVPGKSIHWAGNRIDPPPDIPVCGYEGSLCPDKSMSAYAILSIVLGTLVIILLICFIVGYRHYKSEAEINSMTWRVSVDDVIFCDIGGQFFQDSLHSLIKYGSEQTLLSSRSESVSGDHQLFIPVGFYKGCKVAIKAIDEQNIAVTRALMLELKHMKSLQHDHLVKFYGACLEAPKSFLLTEYCPKGSLQDILENEQFQLDWMFRLSLMHDIVRGMQFLHNSDIRAHGNLKSSNCVVDSRFVLKITDFGLHTLRRSRWKRTNDMENMPISQSYWSNLFWTAPELLRLEDQRPPEGTQKGDVYSFGIIVHEITNRKGPFYLELTDIKRTPQDIIELVKGYPNIIKTPLRPYICSQGTYDDINMVMTRCWSEDPTDRPDFNTLRATIRKFNKDNETGNIVDNLLKRMEQYANNLEELVEERTQDYIEEKKKCEKLLYQLLPESVAAQLIRGQPVVAETFDQVTIYFSDIVGFTAISAESTPMQVVQFLNDLYTCFDAIVENYDVYKVETIGDAYMVVSGLPIRNGIQHSREIGRLALALLEEVHNFRIHHRPMDRLKLRIGLHTGACVAGVVGMKMPRYCLFGDTVNTASRMESNGEALRIHISESTKLALDKFGTFITTRRGYIPIKGKGEMLTYWLDGEEAPQERERIPAYSSDKSLMQRFSAKYSQGNVHLQKQHSVISQPADSAHEFSEECTSPQSPSLQASQISPKFQVKRKISSSSPKLNGYQLETKDFSQHFRQNLPHQFSPNNCGSRVAKDAGHLNGDSYSFHSTKENNRDQSSFRLPLSGTLKNYNTSNSRDSSCFQSQKTHSNNNIGGTLLEHDVTNKSHVYGLKIRDSGVMATLAIKSNSYTNGHVIEHKETDEFQSSTIDQCDDDNHCQRHLSSSGSLSNSSPCSALNGKATKINNFKKSYNDNIKKVHGEKRAIAPSIHNINDLVTPLEFVLHQNHSPSPREDVQPLL